MWDNVEDESRVLTWMVEALRKDTALLVTDGLFDRKKAPRVSGAGWIFCCIRMQQMLRGSFFKISLSASTYRGKLLGLVVIHTLALAVIQFYKLDEALSKICCDNIAALNQSSWRRKRIKTGQKQANLLRCLCTIKTNQCMKFKYKHVDTHQNRIKLWHQLMLEEQINIKCDELAKSTAHRSIIGATSADRGHQLLPLEKAAVSWVARNQQRM